MNREHRCRNCKWYQPKDSVWGYCHRYPPKAEIEKFMPLELKMRYPEVIADEDYCGEFKRNK